MSKNEAQTRRDLIDPVLFKKGWTHDLTKVEVTPGKVNIINGKPQKNKGRTDYLLCLPYDEELSPVPIAIVEAKKEKDSPLIGINQARNYKKKFNIPFAFSTNGHLYCDASDDLDEIEENINIDEFPSLEQLKKRLLRLKKIDFNSITSKALSTPYKGGQNQVFYYQDAAIRRTIEAIGNNQKRILLSLATGTGKTHIAKHLFWKLSKSGSLRKALFLVDRDELRTQAMNHLQGMFGDDADEIKSNSKSFNAKILIGTYQTLNISNEDKDPYFWKKNFPKNYFSHILIDECHRSAWGKWSVILEDNPDAIQIGLTATPRKIKENNRIKNNKEFKEDMLINSNNLKYFGEPLYEYTISSAQEDGFLAACEVENKTLPFDKKEIDKDEVLKNSIVLATGKKPDDFKVKEYYSPQDFEKDLILDDRIQSMSENFFSTMLKNGSVHEKTIIFCASDNHAILVQIEINKLYKNWCRENGFTPKDEYCFKCTASDKNPSSKDLIADFKASKNSHFIATTVDLLSTGVDIPNLNNVVFFKNISSPIIFYQMVGRGTRIGEPRGSKLFFRIIDYTNATRLFGEDFQSTEKNKIKNKNDDEKKERKFDILRIGSKNYKIDVINDGKSILCKRNNKDYLVPYDEYKKEFSDKIFSQIKNILDLKNIWIDKEERKKFINKIEQSENSISLIQKLENLEACDLYDVISYIVFSTNPMSREERASMFAQNNSEWLKSFNKEVSSILNIFAEQFSKGGIEELETQELFNISKFKSIDVLQTFESAGVNSNQIIKETKFRILK